MFIKIVIGKCDFKNINFQFIFSISIHATAYVNLIKYNIVTFYFIIVISLSPSLDYKNMTFFIFYKQL